MAARGNCYICGKELSKAGVKKHLAVHQHNEPNAGEECVLLKIEGAYRALPREQVLSSPALMAGMSMLSSICMDYDASEAWYLELERCAGRLKRSDADYKSVRGWLAYPVLPDALYHVRQPLPGVEPEGVALKFPYSLKTDRYQPEALLRYDVLIYSALLYVTRRGDLRRQGGHGAHSFGWGCLARHS